MCCKLVIPNSKPCFWGEKKALCQFNSDARKHDAGVEFKDNNNKKSIFEVRKNLNYLFAATGLILDS